MWAIGERVSFPTRAFGSALLAQQAAAGGKGEMTAGENVASGCEHIDVPQTSQRMGMFELNGRELDVTGRCLNREHAFRPAC